MTDELTPLDKATLLGVIDAKSMRNDYDREFYETMRRVSTLGVDEVDDGVRRAIVRYIAVMTGPASHVNNGGFVMMGFLHGYMVGRRLKRDIRRKA